MVWKIDSCVACSSRTKSPKRPLRVVRFPFQIDHARVVVREDALFLLLLLGTPVERANAHEDFDVVRRGGSATKIVFHDDFNEMRDDDDAREMSSLVNSFKARGAHHHTRQEQTTTTTTGRRRRNRFCGRRQKSAVREYEQNTQRQQRKGTLKKKERKKERKKQTKKNAVSIV